MKLEQAERAAGIGVPGASRTVSATSYREGRADLPPTGREPPAEDPFAGLNPEIRAAAQAITAAITAQILPRLESLERAIRKLDQSQVK